MLAHDRCSASDEAGSSTAADGVSLRFFAGAGLVLNQMAYNAGKKTSVSTVPPKVPPIKVYASVPQKKLMPKEELWRPWQLEEKSGATSNCAAKYLQTR